MSSRVSAHIIEERSKDRVRIKINENDDAIFRELTGRDYGIDAIVEIFNNGIPTGKIAFIQIKGTNSLITPLSKTPNYISCPNVSVSNLNYSMQNNIPVILLYLSLKQAEKIYYTTLNNNNDNDIMSKLNYNKATIRIPINNIIIDDITPLINIINVFYN